MACSQGPTAELLVKDWTQREVSGAEPLRAGGVFCSELSLSAYSPDTGLVPLDYRWYWGKDLADPIYIVSNAQHHTGHFKLSVWFVKPVDWHVVDIMPSQNLRGPAGRKNVRETIIGQVWISSAPEGIPKDDLVLSLEQGKLHHKQEAACSLPLSPICPDPWFQVSEGWTPRLLEAADHSPLCDSE